MSVKLLPNFYLSDVYHSSTMTEPKTKKGHRTYLTWTEEMDSALLEFLLSITTMAIMPKMDGSHMCTVRQSEMFERSAMWISQRRTSLQDAKPLTNIMKLLARYLLKVGLAGIGKIIGSQLIVTMFGVNMWR